MLAAGTAHADVYPITEEKVKLALDKIRELKPNVKVWWTAGAQPPQLLSTGELAMSSAWSGRVLAIMKEKAPVAMTYADGIAWGNAWVVPKGTPNAKPRHGGDQTMRSRPRPRRGWWRPAPTAPSLGEAAAKGLPRRAQMAGDRAREREADADPQRGAGGRVFRQVRDRVEPDAARLTGSAIGPRVPGPRAAPRAALDRVRRRERSRRHARAGHDAHDPARRLRGRGPRHQPGPSGDRGLSVPAAPRRSRPWPRSRRTLGPQRSAGGGACRGPASVGVRGGGDPRLGHDRRATATRRSPSAWRGSRTTTASPCAARTAWGSTTTSTGSGSAAFRARANRTPDRSRSSPIRAASSARSPITTRASPSRSPSRPGANSPPRSRTTSPTRSSGPKCASSACSSRPPATRSALPTRSPSRRGAACRSSPSRSDAPPRRPRPPSRIRARSPAAISPTRPCSTAMASSGSRRSTSWPRRCSSSRPAGARHPVTSWRSAIPAASGS